MTATEQRLAQLAQEHLGLGHTPDLDKEFGDSGVSSVDAVAFMKVVNSDFGLSLTPGDCAGCTTLRGIGALVDKHSS